MENLSVLDVMENDNVKFEIVEYKKLKGGRSENTAQKLFFMEKVGMTLKHVRITLKKSSSVKMESGALYFMKGNISIKNEVTKGFVRNLGSNLLGGESLFKPEYSGSGEIWLNPTLGHYMLIELDNDEIIVDKGLYYASEASLEVSAVIQKNLSSAFFGGEGLFQTKVKGTGIVALTVPIPIEEVQIYELNNETLHVDGNFALLRRGNVRFSVELATKGLLGATTSGEGFLQTFTGTGEVWIAPTQHVYEQLESGLSMASLGLGGKSSVKVK